MTGQYDPHAPISDKLRLLIARQEDQRRQLARTQADISDELRDLSARRGCVVPMRLEHIQQELAITEEQRARRRSTRNSHRSRSSRFHKEQQSNDRQEKPRRR